MKTFAITATVLALAGLAAGLLGAHHHFGTAIVMGIFAFLLFQGASQNKNNVRRKK